jgi:hypothetical protein
MRWTLSTDWLRAGTGRTGPTANCPRGPVTHAIWPSVGGVGTPRGSPPHAGCGFRALCAGRPFRRVPPKSRGGGAPALVFVQGYWGDGFPGRGILAGCAQSQRPPARRACLVARTRRGLTPPILCGKLVAGRGARGPDSLDGDPPQSQKPSPHSILWPRHTGGNDGEKLQSCQKVDDAVQGRTNRDRVSTTSVVFANESRGTGVA